MGWRPHDRNWFSTHKCQCPDLSSLPKSDSDLLDPGVGTKGSARLLGWPGLTLHRANPLL